MPGPPKKPTELRLLHGTHREDRYGAAAQEVRPPPSALDAPSWLRPFAVELWNYIAPRLATFKLLTEYDRECLAAMCSAYQILRDADDNIREHGLTQLTDKGRVLANPCVAIRSAAAAEFDRWARQFGLTPSARQGMKSGDASRDADELKFFGS